MILSSITRAIDDMNYTSIFITTQQLMVAVRSRHVLTFNLLRKLIY
jgi:hypothetical protein